MAAIWQLSNQTAFHLVIWIKLTELLRAPKVMLKCSFILKYPLPPYKHFKDTHHLQSSLHGLELAFN